MPKAGEGKNAPPANPQPRVGGSDKRPAGGGASSARPSSPKSATPKKAPSSFAKKSAPAPADAQATWNAMSQAERDALIARYRAMSPEQQKAERAAVCANTASAADRESSPCHSPHARYLMDEKITPNGMDGSPEPLIEALVQQARLGGLVARAPRCRRRPSEWDIELLDEGECPFPWGGPHLAT